MQDTDKVDENQIYKGLNFLGKNTALTTPGEVSQPLTGGIASSPAAFNSPLNANPTIGAGAAGQQGESGLDIAGLLKSAIGGGKDASRVVQDLFGGQTRGETGGASLSDTLRSGVGASGALSSIPADQIDAIRGLFGGTGTIPSEVPGSLGKFDLGGTLSDVLRSPFSTGPSAIPFSGTGSVEGAGNVPGGAEALGESGIGSGAGLGTAGAGAGAVAALLGILAQTTGNADLGKAAQALGAGASALGTAGSIGSALGGSAAAAAAAAPAAGVGAGALGGAGLGAIGGAAGAAAAPAAAMMLAWSIANMISPGSAPDVSDIWTGGKPPSYLTFPQRAIGTETQQGKALNALQSALPYVRTQEELGQLLNTYKNYVTTTTGAPLTGGAGSEGDIYSIGTIPGLGPVTHGMATPAFDWGPQTQAVQSQIDKLMSVLPGDKITAQYGQEGGGLTGEAANRLWNQFIPGATPRPYDEADVLNAAFDREHQFSNVLPLYMGANNPYQNASGQDVANGIAAGTISATPQWDPQTGQWVLAFNGQSPMAPGEYWHQTPYWQQIQQAQQAAASGAPGAAASAAPGTGFISNTMDELIRRAALAQ